MGRTGLFDPEIHQDRRLGCKDGARRLNLLPQEHLRQAVAAKSSGGARVESHAGPNCLTRQPDDDAVWGLGYIGADAKP